MFYVKKKNENPTTTFEEFIGVGEKKAVYAVNYKRGYPFFTFYENGQWITRSAKYYEPIIK